MKRLTMSLLLLAALTFTFAQNSAHDINNKLGRGINFGNMFENPRSGNGLGPAIYPYYFEEIADKGFEHIRMPIKWSDYALTEAPYTVEAAFIDTIKTVVEMALEHNLLIMINMHHYDEIFDDPDGHTERFLAIWSQISEAFKNYSDSLLFEPLNEPHGSLDQAKWNALFPKVLDTIRVMNPTRKVVIGPPDWNSSGSVNKLAWPVSDTNLIMTIHYYNPFEFTHQGASWVVGANAWLGTKWDSTASQTQAMINDFAQAATFSETKNVPVHVGEFGSYSMADPASRRKWTACIARTIENFGFSWAYWEFKAGFGAYDDGLGFWKNDLLYGLTEQVDPREKYPEPWEVSNPTFERGLSSWSFYVQGGAVADVSVQNEEVLINIATPGASNWMVQFMQSGLELIKNAQYRFSYDARYEGTQTKISPSLGMSVEPYTGYSGGNEVTLTDQMQNYSFDFTMTNPSDKNARVAFNVSYVTTKVYLDNLILELLYMPTLVGQITIGPDPAEINTDGGNIQLTAEVLPEDAIDKSIQWEIISGGSLASISSNGLLTANGSANGTVKVKASAKDGSEVYDEINIVISKQAVGMEELDLPGISVKVRGQALEYMLMPSDHSRKIALYSVDGKKVYSGQINANAYSGTIPMQAYESNIYILEIIDRNTRDFAKVLYRK